MAYCKRYLVCGNMVSRFDDNMLCTKCESEPNESFSATSFSMKEIEDKYLVRVEMLADKVIEMDDKIASLVKFVSNKDADRFEKLQKRVENETVKHYKRECDLLHEQIGLYKQEESKSFETDMNNLKKLQVLEDTIGNMPKDVIQDVIEGVKEANHETKVDKFRKSIEKIHIPSKEELLKAKEEETKKEQELERQNRLAILAKPKNSIAKQADKKKVSK